MFLSKKAQLGIFVVLGILLILGSVFFISSQTNVFESSSSLSLQSNDQQFVLLNNYVESCMDKGLDSSIDFLGFQGGYFEYEKETVNEGIFKIPLYVKEGEEPFSPSEADFEKEINKVFLPYFLDCMHKTKNVIPQGYNITFDTRDFSATGQFKGENLVYKIHLPISMTGQESFRTFSDFEIEKHFPYDNYLIPVESILAVVQESPLEIPISVLNRLSSQNNFRYEILNEENVLIYTFIFSEGTEEEYVHAFAVGGLEV